MSSTLDVVFFGVREQLEGGVEHAVIEFDFKHFRMTKYFDTTQIFSVSFGEITASQTDGTLVKVFFANPSVPDARFLPFNMQDLEDFCSLLNTIIDNIHEVLDISTSTIKDLCLTLQPRLCLRKCLVVQKSFKRKGKKSGISKYVKLNRQRQTGVTVNTRAIGFLVLTNKNLLCFEEEKSIVPVCVYPVGCVEVKKSSDSQNITLNCSGDKGIFTVAIEGDDAELFSNACQKAKTVNPVECEEISTLINEIQSLFEGTFDKTSEEHIDWLRRLWDASNLGISDTGGEDIPFAIQANRWKDLGFQRDDPVSDLRATGLLGLQNLVYFAEQHPGLFLSMARNQQQSSEMEYPFATAGINITYLMITLLGLRNPRVWYPTVDTHPLFFYNRHAWEELYTIIFRLFDQKWNQMLVGYMGFQKVIDSTREDVAGFLRHKNPMAPDDPFIFEMLGILLNDLENFKTDSHRKSEMATHAFAGRDGIADKSQPSSVTVAEPSQDEKSSEKESTSEKDLSTPQPDVAPESPRLNRVSFVSLPQPSSTWRQPTTPKEGVGRRSVFVDRRPHSDVNDNTTSQDSA